MLIVFGIMASGVVAGYILRRVPNILIIDKLIMGFIYLLLLFLGIGVGANEIIINNIARIGCQALLITLGAMSGSVLMAWLIYVKFFKNEECVNSKVEEK